MAGFTRTKLEQFWQQWLAANREAERLRDWKMLADFYAEEATYGWMYTPDEHFMAVGREEIRQYALGTEMTGLDGWHYDYVATVMDETAGMIIGFWKQRAGIEDENGREYEIAGIGGSWFGYGEDADGHGRFEWQRDWFDLNAAAKTFLSLAESGKATQGLLDCSTACRWTVNRSRATTGRRICLRRCGRRWWKGERRESRRTRPTPTHRRSIDPWLQRKNLSHPQSCGWCPDWPRTQRHYERRRRRHRGGVSRLLKPAPDTPWVAAELGRLVTECDHVRRVDNLGEGVPGTRGQIRRDRA